MWENKFIRILAFGGFLLVTGIIYQEFYRPPELAPVAASGRTVEIHMRVLENEWAWEPAELRVAPGDRVVLHIFNEDAYDHGFALEVFGINKRLFPKRETTIEFLASKEGAFNFYCSVPCGEGHYRQTGKFIVTPGALEAGDASAMPVELSPVE
ncbi:MAG: hypothetical protein A2991_01280 [Candidatus Terrybacteria bacterium RIFCSPLOWO2_01_FULL_58_14]|uniref:Cytochrome oxidase subunit II copper A binding domain-containing protein n=2 Tax=Candidatus Terryibacteriota TaxID=1817920 RepID=A0A1G2PYP0_9BACT|nr:MAG: hypothetical protein A2682_01670 [Candidatus Terrybacteria bacterium RIFCSPHIGHO2_01_FULL_58_15]OHA53454.1 MAG: hypothetical protein A2991_01280 [Candidatus Terrybacteria bacterium RIFCSPLOWO2_01_FULL_58_14]